MAKKILVVDDALFMRNLIKGILTKNGYEVCGEGANAIEAVELYRKLKPDMMTLDIVMPKMEEMDGITAVKQIMTADSHANIVVVSALAERRLVEEALSFGAKDFVVKPFTAEKLLEVVRRVLGEN
jgi:two-component system chemotaxis response regulator CheY